MLLLPGHEEWSISAHREGCAEVRDVYVVEHARRRGIASALMNESEGRARHDGFDKVGLTVSLDEQGAAARAMYRSLGYSKAHGPFVSSTSLATDLGLRPVFVVGLYLTKTL